MAEPPAKRARAAESEECDDLLHGFETVKILMNDVKAKKVHVLGKCSFKNFSYLNTCCSYNHKLQNRPNLVNIYSNFVLRLGLQKTLYLRRNFV